MPTHEQNVTYYNDTSMRVVKKNYSKTKSDMDFHSHDYLLISLLLSGSVLEHTSNYTTIANSSAVFIKPPGINHSNAFPKNASILSIRVYDWEYYKLRFNDIEVIQNGAVLYYFLNVLKSVDKKLALAELKKSLLNHFKIGKNKTVPVWLSEVKRFVESHFNESIQIRRLAKEIGKHPVHLSRTFKAFYGVDIKSYQKQIRLHNAISEIGSQGKNLTQIAQDCGFYDQSHFSREFKKTTKMPPRKAVKLLSV